MANASVLFRNLADAGIITADSAAMSMPASLLQVEHVRKRWRSDGSNEAALLCDLGAALDADTFGLFGLTVGAGATVRLRVSTVDDTGAAGDALDTGILTSASPFFDPDYGAFLHAAAAAVTGRYVRFDLAEVDAPYLEAGRMVVGERSTFSANFTPGPVRGRMDLSGRGRTRGGQLLLDRQARLRVFTLSFDFVSAAEWDAIVEPIDRDRGMTEDVLFMLDAESDNLPRDAVWGLLADISPVAFTAIPDLFQKQYRLEERL